MSNRLLPVAASFFVAGALALEGCSDASDASDAKGAPPTLEHVIFDRTEVAVGRIETLTVTLDYADADGDVARLGRQLKLAGATTKAPELLDMPEASGQKQGRQQLAFQLGVSQAGAVDVDFWLVDAKGNESAKVTTTITVK
jgi:hypothetical protein